MLVLSAESACDICAEPYSQESLPHSIPCGHTFCAQCLNKVSKGGASQWAPRNTSSCGCPLCREPFAATDIRRIRIDTAPSHSPPYPQVLPYPNYFPAQNLSTKAGAGAAFGKGPIDEDALDAGSNETVDRVTVEAKRLEQRVADAAKRRCTFEEISALHREVQQWLDKQGTRRPDREHGSLRLSAALLGAILVNGFAYNESKKQLKGVEVELKEKLDAVEGAKRRLELEVHRQRTEVYTLKQEMSKLTGAPPPALPPVTPTTVPVSSSTAAPPVPRPLGSSLTAAHSGTSNLSHRTQTPAPLSSRSHTPAAPSRSQTPSAASAYSGYMHHTSTVSPPRSTVASASSSRSPERQPVPGQHQRWMPQTTREDDGDLARPGTAFNPHARAYSLSGRLAGPGARPQTAAGFRP